MKKFSILCLSLMLTVAIGSDDEEQRYLEKDGTIYKVNSSSLHLTPKAGDQKVTKALD